MVLMRCVPFLLSRVFCVWRVVGFSQGSVFQASSDSNPSQPDPHPTQPNPSPNSNLNPDQNHNLKPNSKPQTSLLRPPLNGPDFPHDGVGQRSQRRRRLR